MSSPLQPIHPDLPVLTWVTAEQSLLLCLLAGEGEVRDVLLAAEVKAHIEAAAAGEHRVQAWPVRIGREHTLQLIESIDPPHHEDHPVGPISVEVIRNLHDQLLHAAWSQP